MGDNAQAVQCPDGDRAEPLARPYRLLAIPLFGPAPSYRPHLSDQQRPAPSSAIGYWPFRRDPLTDQMLCHGQQSYRNHQLVPFADESLGKE
jgi:hypothetical protein